MMTRLIQRLLGGEVEGVDGGRTPRQGARNAQRGFLEDDKQGQVETMHLGKWPGSRNQLWQVGAKAGQGVVFLAPLTRRHFAYPPCNCGINRHVSSYPKWRD